MKMLNNICYSCEHLEEQYDMVLNEDGLWERVLNNVICKHSDKDDLPKSNCEYYKGVEKINIEKCYERIYEPRESGYDFQNNKIIYDCDECCADVNFNDEKCPNGHRLDWKNKKEYWRRK